MVKQSRYSAKMVHSTTAFSEKAPARVYNPNANHYTKQRMAFSLLTDTITGQQESFLGKANTPVRMECPENLSDVLYSALPTIFKGNAIPVQVPDLLIRTGIKTLQQHFCDYPGLDTRIFESPGFPVTFNLYPPFADVEGIFATDAMVIVVDKSKFGHKKLPSEWYELLHPNLYRSIALCCSKDHFYDALFFPFIKMGGEEAVKQFVSNVMEEKEPKELLASIDNGNAMGASVYVMPYSYAKSIRDALNFKIIWPADGYIPIPVQILVKSGELQQFNTLINYLYSTSFATKLEHAGFISLYSEARKCRSDWMEQELACDNMLLNPASKMTRLPV